MGSVEKVKEILIEEVKKVAAIWDKGHRNHHNRYHLEKQWKKISQDVGIADSRARKTWKNLRQEFGKQMTKALKADCTLENLHSEWPFFQQLMFLKDQFTNKKPCDELLPVKMEDNDGLSTRMEGNDDTDVDYRTRRINTDVAEGMDSPTPSPAGSSRESLSSPSPVPSLDTYNLSSPTEQPRRKSSSRYPPRKRKRPEDPCVAGSSTDEDVGFFNSLLPHMKRLNPQQKLIFRLKMQQYLYDLLYGYNNDRHVMPYEANNMPNMTAYPIQNSQYHSPRRNSTSPNAKHASNSKQPYEKNILSNMAVYPMQNSLYHSPRRNSNSPNATQTTNSKQHYETNSMSNRPIYSSHSSQYHSPRRNSISPNAIHNTNSKQVYESNNMPNMTDHSPRRNSTSPNASETGNSKYNASEDSLRESPPLISSHHKHS